MMRHVEARESPGRSGEDDALDADALEDVRLAVYRSLADTGRLPSTSRLTSLVGTEERLDEAVHRLAEQRAWALGPAGEIVLAHPFATRSFGYSVMSGSTLWWGGCAWDAFAIPHLVPDCGPVVIATTCPACEKALAWRVDTSSAPTGRERAHFLVPTAHMWDDVVHTCSNQLLFCNDACIDRWLEQTGNPDGYRMDLDVLWRFAAGWYAGRLERGYRRREPAEALEYFAEVGLRGPFWGLP
jgi:hypothetical protein